MNKYTTKESAITCYNTCDRISDEYNINPNGLTLNKDKLLKYIYTKNFF